MTDAQKLRTILFDAVDNVNNKLVLEGLPNELDRFVPLLEIHYIANDYGIYFFGHCLWDSDNDPRYGWELSTDLMEKHLIQRIGGIRHVLNHVTSSIGSTL